VTDSRDSGQVSTSSLSTAVPSPLADETRPPLETETPTCPNKDAHRESVATDEGEGDDGGFAAIKPAAAARQRPSMKQGESKPMTEEDLFHTLSRRRTSNAGLSRSNTQATASSTEDEQEEINRLMSRMFGTSRQEASEEEKTRHFGVIFKNLTVKGMGLGAALQPSVGDIFMGLPRLLKGLVSKGPRKAAGKPPVRTILDDFSGCIKPGEMLLVLGRPGAGCSTFLKMLGNQRFGYEEISGDVTYGGTDAKEMAKKYRSEVLYNPEDDLHYATLKVKETLKFALKTRTPGKASRKEGESRSDYVNEFLRVVSKLFWIEHTMDTKVGNELVRGVSGGEKKRVSIAEAMITKASVQSWDNSTRGLDASTALEYVQSLRSLTNMARISTSVALYQAGESLFDLFDKVVLIHEGRCCYFGPSDDAVKYFKSLGFVQPERWTSADFIT
jgi:ATP-binding cassette subfamily G (WHITE) protein 2 (SNQ2)